MTPDTPKPGPFVRVEPGHHKPWLALLHAGRCSAAGPHRLIGWPDEVSLCYVSRGAGYVFCTDRPGELYGIRAFPISDVVVIRERQLVVFATFTDVYAYGRRGLEWESARVMMDELRIVRVEPDVLRIAGFYEMNAHAEFTVDLRTGAFERDVLE